MVRGLVGHEFKHPFAGERPALLHRGLGGLINAGGHELLLVSLRAVVGAARFELATPCSQSRCATRLRYAPIPTDRLAAQARSEQPLATYIIRRAAIG